MSVDSHDTKGSDQSDRKLFSGQWPAGEGRAIEAHVTPALTKILIDDAGRFTTASFRFTAFLAFNFLRPETHGEPVGFDTCSLALPREGM